ncbi:MAG: prepilin-type N-terminal cleavage/methylation domain-containing protein [Parcubacteria group bacterium]
MIFAMHSGSSGRSLKGFTLIELLIVIAILAVLAAAVVVVLNPAELLARARDTQRLNDLDTVRNALNIYITTVSPIDLGDCVAAGRATFQPGATMGPFANHVGSVTVPAAADMQKVNNAGWVNVNFTQIPGGAPLPYLPIDPTNDANYFYAYACSESPNYIYELAGRLESQTHRDKMKIDGGSNSTCATYIEKTCFYELGTAPGLSL